MEDLKPKEINSGHLGLRNFIRNIDLNERPIHRLQKIIKEFDKNRFDDYEPIFQKIGEKFDKAPASSAISKHSAFKGGLIHHITSVMAMGSELLINSGFEIPVESLVLTATLHDLHKVCDFDGVDYYTPNILKSGAQSDKVPYKINDEVYRFQSCQQTAPKYLLALARRAAREHRFSSGAFVSLLMIEEIAPTLFSKINEYEKQAIRYHDLGYGDAKYEIAGEELPLTIILHCADMLASRFENPRPTVEGS